MEQRPYCAGPRVLLVDIGFQPVDVCGDLDHMPYDASARRQVAVAREAAF